MGILIKFASLDCNEGQINSVWHMVNSFQGLAIISAPVLEIRDLGLKIHLFKVIQIANGCTDF